MFLYVISQRKSKGIVLSLGNLKKINNIAMLSLSLIIKVENHLFACVVARINMCCALLVSFSFFFCCC